MNRSIVHNIFAFIILSGFLMAAVQAFAGEEKHAGIVFIGVEYVNHDVEMKTEFIRRTSGIVTEHSFFDNPYSSGAQGLFAGYTIPWKRTYISGRVFFDLFNDEFVLSSGSSRFVNDLNYAFGFDLMPGIYLYKGLSLFGKLGLGLGNFDFIKSSPTSTTYNVNDNLRSYTLGIGLACDITQRFTAKIGADLVRYDKIEIDAYLDPRMDRTLVKPKSESLYISLQYNFR